jgi:tRNA(Ile2) C34 agmatinyltransferase TiaS
VILVGIDDTDDLDSPGTNQLARHIVHELEPCWSARMITRHQLLDDPRVPCTKRNGCVAINFEISTARSQEELVAAIHALMLPWCAGSSDPGLCVVAGEIPAEVMEFGRRCQRELVTQHDARELAAKHGIQLSGLGGTEDGVIGALAAVGLAATRDDGRVIYLGDSRVDHFDISGVYPVSRLSEFGVDEVRQLEGHELVTTGTVALGKRLRPSFRQGKVVLFVSPTTHAGTDWSAERVL